MTSVAVTFDQGGGGGGTASLLAFNAANAQIDSQTVNGSGTATSSVAGISYILALINSQSIGFDVTPSIKVLQFNTAPAAAAVPEPGSALAGMLALGVCLGGLGRRRRAK